MIIGTNLKIALPCPQCGKLDRYDLSRFQFKPSTSVSVDCSCGANKMLLITSDKKNLKLHVPCPFCNNKHVFQYYTNKLWNSGVYTLICPETHLELGFLGAERSVQREIRQAESYLEELIDEIGFDDYFCNPEIMFEVLNVLHDIAESGKLFCQCGNFKIDVDVYPERFELHCAQCDSIQLIFAEEPGDLKAITEMEEIVLTKSGFNALDAVKTNNRIKSFEKK